MSYEVLSDKAWKVRLKSENQLIALGETAVPMLVEALSYENPHARALVSLVLGIIGDKSAVSSLIARLQDDDETVRLYAVEALGRLGDVSAQEALEKAREDKSSHVANYAKLALKRLKGEIKISQEAEPLKEQFLSALNESVWDTAQLNKAAPDFSLLDSDGNRVSLKDYRGKKRVVLVFLLADWWGYCNRQVSQLREKYSQFQNYDAEILIIDPHELWRVKRFKEKWSEETPILFPFLSDPTSQVCAAYGIAKQLNVHAEWVNRPAVFIVDKSGVIRYMQIGKSFKDRATPEELLEILKEMKD